MDKSYHPTLYNWCNYWPMLGLKLTPVSEMDSWVYIDQGLITSLANKIVVYVLVMVWRHGSSTGSKWMEENLHRNRNVVRVTALVVTGEVETCLQRLQWRPGQSSWRHFHFCGSHWKPSHHDANFVVTDGSGGCRFASDDKVGIMTTQFSVLWKQSWNKIYSFGLVVLLSLLSF